MSRDAASLRTNGIGKKLETTATARGQGTWSDEASASYERVTPASPSEVPPQWERTSADFRSERSVETSYHDTVRDEGYSTILVDSPGEMTYLGTTDATGWTRSSSVVSGTPEDYAYVTRDASRHQRESAWDSHYTAPATTEGPPPSTPEGVTAQTVSEGVSSSTGWGISSLVTQSHDNRDGRVVGGVASESRIDIYRSSDSSSQSNWSGLLPVFWSTSYERLIDGSTY